MGRLTKSTRSRRATVVRLDASPGNLELITVRDAEAGDDVRKLVGR